MASVLVGYASKHGGTQGIAEWIGEVLRTSGHAADVRSIGEVQDLQPYDAFVIGSAAYMGSWLKPAAAFVRNRHATLAEHPLWLFSSGPLGTETKDAQGNDLLTISAPKEFAEFQESVHPRGTRVFFGALDPDKLSFSEKVIRKMPAGAKLLPEGDFRARDLVEEWAREIAHALEPVTAPSAGVR